MARVEIQLALDTGSTVEAIAAARAAADEVDIIEAGTVLCLNDGLHAVRALRAEFPATPIVADIRIARAGRKFADLAFSAGADRITVIGESGMRVIEGALRSADEHGGSVEVELGEDWTESEVEDWAGRGVSHIVAHRSGLYTAQEDDDIRATLERLEAISLGNAKVTLAGGISPRDVTFFPRSNFDVVAVGSAIVKASDPGSAARELRDQLRKAERTEQWQPTT